MPPHGTARCLTVLLYCARWRALRNPSPVCVHSVQLSVAYTEHSSSQSGQQCSIALDTALLHQGTLASPRHYQGCRLLVRRGSVIACLATTRSSPLSGLSTPRLAWLGSVSARLATSALASSPRSRRLASIRARLASRTLSASVLELATPGLSSPRSSVLAASVLELATPGLSSPRSSVLAGTPSQTESRCGVFVLMCHSLDPLTSMRAAVS
jgi:hypothetical protein